MTLRLNSCAERDGHGPDAAGPAVDEHGVAFGGKAALEQVHPDGEQGLRHRRRFGQRKDFRHGEAGPGRRDAIFGIAAARDERADLLADEVSSALSRFDDRAGHFESEDVRRSGRRRIEAPALEDVGPIDAGRGDLDQHLARADARHRPFDQRKLLRAVRLRRDDGLHRSWNGAGHCGALIDSASRLGQRFRPWTSRISSRASPATRWSELAKQDLDPISIEELLARIEALKAEIARVEAHMNRAQAHRSAADELFKK